MRKDYTIEEWKSFSARPVLKRPSPELNEYLPDTIETPFSTKHYQEWLILGNHNGNNITKNASLLHIRTCKNENTSLLEAIEDNEYQNFINHEIKDGIVYKLETAIKLTKVCTIEELKEQLSIKQ